MRFSLVLLMALFATVAVAKPAPQEEVATEPQPDSEPQPAAEGEQAEATTLAEGETTVAAGEETTTSGGFVVPSVNPAGFIPTWSPSASQSTEAPTAAGGDTTEAGAGSAVDQSTTRSPFSIPNFGGGSSSSSTTGAPSPTLLGFVSGQRQPSGIPLVDAMAGR